MDAPAAAVLTEAHAVLAEAAHAASGQAGRPWFLDEVDAHSRLDRMEMALRACTLWLWLDLRFEGVYGHVEEVLALRGALNDGIERQLGGKRPLAQLRRAFPVSFPKLGDFTVAEPSDYPDDAASGYQAIHRDCIDPIERAQALALRITTAIANQFGAHG